MGKQRAATALERLLNPSPHPLAQRVQQLEAQLADATARAEISERRLLELRRHIGASAIDLHASLSTLQTWVESESRPGLRWPALCMRAAMESPIFASVPAVARAASSELSPVQELLVQAIHQRSQSSGDVPPASDRAA